MLQIRSNILDFYLGLVFPRLGGVCAGGRRKPTGEFSTGKEKCVIATEEEEEEGKHVMLWLWCQNIV